MLLRTLGGLSLSEPSQTRPKPLLLLAYLSLEGPQPRHRLARIFWPDSSNPDVNLRMALHHLRKTLPGRIVQQRDQISTLLNTDLEPLLKALQSDLVDDVRVKYSGSFLAGVYGQWGNELEEWIFRSREHLGGLVRQTYLRAARQAHERGDLQASGELAAQAIAVPGAGPIEAEELFPMHQMLSLAQNPAAAQIRQLAEEMGISIQPVERRQMAVEESSGSVHPSQPAGTFVGRTEEIGVLLALLNDRDDRGRLLTILGPGGVGKSRLAAEVASRGAAHFAGPTAVVSLEGTPDAGLIAGRICQALGVSPTMTVDALSLAVRTLTPQRSLLILDNMEHLGAPGTAVVDALLSACPSLRLVVTSRQPLEHLQEQLFHLDGLDCGESGEAIQFFALKARRLTPEFILTSANRPVVQQICTRLGGVPLALELAAAWIRTLSVTELAGELGRDLDLLTVDRPESTERHASMRTVFRESWFRLSAEEQRVLRRLSVFLRGFMRGAASAVVGASPTVLAALIDQSLLQMDLDGRYRLHPLISQFAAEELAKDPVELADSQQRKALYYYQYAIDAGPHLLGPDQSQWFDQLAADHVNLRDASDWALENGQPDLVARMQLALWTYVWCREDHVWGRNQLMRAFQHPALSPAGRATVLWAAGGISRMFGDSVTAGVMLDESVALARTHGLTEILMLALLQRGVLRGADGTADDSREDMEACISVARQLGNPTLESYTYSYLGEMMTLRGQYRQAVALLELAVQTAQVNVGQWQMARALLKLANLLRDQGEFQAAETRYLACTALLTSLDRTPELAECLAQQAQGRYEAGDADGSRRLLEDTLDLFTHGPTPTARVLALALSVQAALFLDEGRLVEAEGALVQALQGLQRTDAMQQTALLLTSFARLYWLRGRTDRAAELMTGYNVLTETTKWPVPRTMARRLAVQTQLMASGVPEANAALSPTQLFQNLVQLCLTQTNVMTAERSRID